MHKRKTTRGKATKGATVAPRGIHLPRRSAEIMLNELKSRLLEISDLGAAGSLLQLGSGHLYASGRCSGAQSPKRDIAPARERRLLATRQWVSSVRFARPLLLSVFRRTRMMLA